MASKTPKTASTTPKPFVFVLMPFDASFDDVYRLGIQAACKEAGAYCERVDEQIYDESMLERIYNQIAKADIIVADMTGKNPNVFYETGYAHALGKRTILLTKNSEDIPFDLKHYVHIVYQGKISDLKTQLKRRIKYYVEHPEKTTRLEEPDLECYVETINIEKNGHINIEIPKFTSSGPWVQRISIGFLNKSETTVNLGNKIFCLLFPVGMAKFDETDAIKLPDGQIMIQRKGAGDLYPQM